MAVDVEIPTLGESVNEGVIVRWLKSDGDAVKTDEPLFELETDKASVEIPAPGTGVVKILKQEGTTVQVGEVVARIEEREAKADQRERDIRPREEKGNEDREAIKEEERDAKGPAAADKARRRREPQNERQDESTSAVPQLSPAVRRLVEEHDLDASALTATGRGGRLTKGDVLAYIEEARSEDVKDSKSKPAASPEPMRSTTRPAATGDSETERVPMTRLRQRIAERLRQAQQTAAILTTFNEVDMTAVMSLRARYKSRFAEAHGVPLGFMSFFARSCIAALQELTVVNAQIDGADVVYSKRVHLGIAVATDRGLVVPILRNADQKSFPEIERGIEQLAARARENKLSIDDLSGGTFTISNGGVYGSLLSTPILNPPQSAILGMHKIEKRPMVVDDEVVIRPMMYLALSYDHRLIDGADAVTFLVRIKERLEDPDRLLLDL